MGLFVIVADEDGVDALIGAALTNIKLFKESQEYGKGSSYLLGIAAEQLAIAKLKVDDE